MNLQHVNLSMPWKVLVKEESLNGSRCSSTINGACTSGILYVYIPVHVTIRQTRDDQMFPLGLCSLLPVHIFELRKFFFLTPQYHQHQRNTTFSHSGNITSKRAKGSRHL
jgi:hypothetical protein